MAKLSDTEKIIVRELIKNPRISDNQMSIKTGIPLKTINRRRKSLEEKNLINYHCYLNNTAAGTGSYNGRSIYIIILKEGITRKFAIEKILAHEKHMKFAKHILYSFLGEYEGNVALIILLESSKFEDLTEIFNAEIAHEIERHIGSGGIKRVITLPIYHNLRILRNYLPDINIKQGKLKPEWPDGYIFVDE